MNISSDTFILIGNIYTASTLTRSTAVALRRFKSFFGVTPSVCAIIWEKLKEEIPAGAEPKHLLWSLLFLKQNAVEHNRRSILGADEKTIRKWTWEFVKILSNMDVIIWENRFNMASVGQTAFCSIDGIDFKIEEPKPFSRLWYSHKFRASGLRYEIGLNIRTGDIVWAFGGYPCGQYPDLVLARELYVHSVRAGEKTLADKGYKDSVFFILPNPENTNIHGRIMARHETVNKRLRHFKILKDPFRHDLSKHPMLFHALVNITQVILTNGEPPNHYLMHCEKIKINYK